MSTNERPKQDALADDTLRRVGERDLSGDRRSGSQLGPPNPRNDIEEPQVAGRGYLPARDYELHMGTPPTRIDRLQNTRVFGFVSPTGMGGYNPERSGEVMEVGHVPMYHFNRPVAPAPSISTADGLYIPATKIGNPLQ